jgi:hypothetical protein
MINNKFSWIDSQMFCGLDTKKICELFILNSYLKYFIFKRHKSDKLCHSNDKVKVSFYVIKHIK